MLYDMAGRFGPFHVGALGFEVAIGASLVISVFGALFMRLLGRALRRIPA
jgi:hypothetical protein